jgi:hypothetical protein
MASLAEPGGRKPRRPKRPEIDHRTIKLLVGAIAIGLPIAVSVLAAPYDLKSISESYYETDWTRSVLVGFLYAIAAFLAAYNGRTAYEMFWSKVAAGAAFLIAMFPCNCGRGAEIIPGLHYGAAGLMFIVLAYFCAKFYMRAVDKMKDHPRAKLRAMVYALCGAAIVVSIIALGVDAILVRISPGNAFSDAYKTFVYWFETTGLAAFGIAWLVASHVIPGINGPEERFSLVRPENPPG